MFYQIVLIMPYLVLASCVLLVVAIYAICTSKRVLDKGFMVSDRRKISLSERSRTAILPPPAPAYQALDVRALSRGA